MSSSKSGWEPPSPEVLQQMLPQYEITGMIGRGGMGAVYRGRQVNLDREVAIKILPENFSQGGDELNFVARFKQEARAMANLRHPIIISLYAFGETSGGQFYFVMEFVEGMDVHQYIQAQGGRLPQESAVAICAHVLDALGYAHNQGIVHRDIKPANILLNRVGQVKIADFGLAKKFQTTGDTAIPALTMTNMAIGTPDFVAPEALESGKRVDHRADLYAIGVMLYQMLTGNLPRGKFKTPSELNAEVDPRLDHVIDKAMQTNPEHRYANAARMREDLDSVMSKPVTRIKPDLKSAAVPAAVPMKGDSMAGSVRKGAPTAGSKARKSTPGLARRRNDFSISLVVGAAAVIGGIIWIFTEKESGKDNPNGENKGRALQAGLEDKGNRLSLTNPAPPAGSARTQSGLSAGPSSAPPGALSTHPATAVAPSSQKADTDQALSRASIPKITTPDPALGRATKENPCENTLGMRFVPVSGTNVLFCIHETRWKDYAAYAKENSRISSEWRNQTNDNITPRDRPEDHPVFRVYWDDASNFCSWLSKKERRTYRLPTDREWSLAVGLGEYEKWSPGVYPKNVEKPLDIFPWGKGWPPPAMSGNYNDESRKMLDAYYIRNYQDGFITTAPVMSFEANKYGIFDLGGNVSEWVADYWDETTANRIKRGASYWNGDLATLRASHRVLCSPSHQQFNLGFRCVVEVD